LPQVQRERHFDGGKFFDGMMLIHRSDVPFCRIPRSTNALVSV
jgi:hypothetical protein